MKNIISFLLSFTVLTLTAQTELPTGQIEVVKDFEVRLTETKKIRIIPQPVPIDSTVRRYDYKLLAPSPSIDYLSPEIKPLAINSEKKPLYYPLYAKVGYGSPNSLLGLFSYDHLQNESFQWGVDFRHLNANNKKIPVQKFSDSRGRLNASYLINENLKLDGYLDGHVEKDYFYGAEPIPSNEESLKRIFNRYDGYLSVERIDSVQYSLRYKAFIEYLTDKDNLGSRENSFLVGGEVGTSVGSNEFPVGVKILADLTRLAHVDEHTLNNFLFTPYADLFFGHFKFHLAGTALLRTNHNEIIPDFKLSYGIARGRMSIHAGWDGVVKKNDFHSLSSYNPYIDTRLDSLTNLISRRLFAGLSGKSGPLAYEINASYTSFESMAFFLQNEDEPEQFDPIYDNGSFIGVEAAVRFEVLKHVFLRTEFYQRVYTLDHENKPWHIPSFGLNGQLTYSGGDDKYHASFIFNTENGLPFRTVGGTEGNLDPLVDLNIHGDYYFSKPFGVFMELNNLLGNHRERWASYPSYGFNAKVGVLFRLP